MSNAWKLVEAVVDTPLNEEKNDGTFGLFID